MKQLQKSDLKEGDIYVSDPSYDNSYEYLNKHSLSGRGFGLDLTFEKKFRSDWILSYKNMREATPKEKHWLETCIKADKFVEYDEAMKTFIPEYVECTLQQIGSDYKLGEIYKVSSTSQNVNKIESHNNQGMAFYQMNKHRFKPSTKEAYDAQFVVKEPEFVLPEKWAIIITNENKDIVNEYRKSIFNNSNISCNLNVDNVHLSDRYDGTYYHYNKHYFKEHTRCKEITTEQFKQYVLKENTTVTEKSKVVFEEPKDKVIQTTSSGGKIRIDKVECSEGGVYKIGDKITVFDKTSPNKGKPFTITGFRWNNAKTEICVGTELHKPYGIRLSKIELYVEPKVKIVDDFVLPEKWCVEVNEELHNRFGYYKAYGYHHSIQINDTNKWSIKIKEEFTEITLEQFKKYVLKNE